MLEKIKPIIQQFDIEGEIKHVDVIEVGHINETYKIGVQQPDKTTEFVLQRINTAIFKNPEQLMDNIKHVGLFLKHKKYPKKVLLPIPSLDNQLTVKYKGGHWRLFPFIPNTQTFNEVDSTEKAYAAAFTFGEYARYLNDFDVHQLNSPIPDFHNTNLRFQQFFYTTKSVKGKRKDAAQACIDKLLRFRPLLGAIKGIKIPLRVVHSDTKINNILFDKDSQQPVCVVDLDTLMPGTIIYDFGDMVRTFTPPLDENSDQYDQIFVRKDILTALTDGYLAGLDGSLTMLEEKLLFYGGRLIIYEQALRFLTDYLKGDVYYKVEYAQQNLIRAKNQLHLLEDFVKF